jgi:hypothetical protein
LYFNLFSASFRTTFLSAGIATSISVHVFSFWYYYHHHHRHHHHHHHHLFSRV